MIFDTNFHVTVNDKCDNKIKKNSFKKILYLHKENKLKGFSAVGIPRIGNYNHKLFFQKISNYKFIHPVAGIDLNNDIEKEFNEIKKLGYRSIKIHPRSCGISIENLDYDKLAFFCNKNKFNILICTYFNKKIENTYSEDPKLSLIKFLKKLERNKILLMHGGCERVMEFAELIRFNQNIFLDLSLTLMKYQGSSVDNDLKFLFNNFDRKITLGSDYPELNYPLFLKRIKFFSKNVAINKLKNIYFKNAQSIFI